MSMEQRNTRCFYTLLLFVAVLVSPTLSVCRRYQGEVCRNLRDILNIPAGKTDAQIDQEIRELTKDYQPKMSLCKIELQRAICNMLYGTCGYNDTSRKVEIPIKTCRNVCQWYTKNSVCYQQLPPGSNVKAWLDRQDCNSLPTEKEECSSFYSIGLEDNFDVFKQQCRTDYNNHRTDSEYLIQASLTPNTIANKEEMEQILPKHFPYQMFADTKCKVMENNKPIYRCFLRRLLFKVPNVNKESLKKDIKPILLCTSEKGKTELKIISTKEPLYTPDKYLSLENVNYAIMKSQGEKSSKLVVFGDTQMCFRDNFKVNVQPNTKGMTVFQATSEAKPYDNQLMNIFLFSSRNRLPINKFARNVINRWFTIFKWKFPNIKWTALWDKKGKRYDLVKDSGVEARLYTTADDVGFGHTPITLEYAELFLSRDQVFSAYIMIDNFTIKDFAISALEEKLVSYAVGFMDAYSVPQLFTVDKASYFVKTKGDFTNIIPKDTGVDEFERSSTVRRLRGYNEYDTVLRAIGKTNKSTKPQHQWLKNVTYQMESFVLAKSDEWRLRISFDYKNANRSCEAKPEKWTFLKKTMDWLTGRGDYGILHRAITCDYCCQMNEDRLVQVKMFDLNSEGASIMLRVRNRNQEIDHLFKKVPYTQLVLFRI
ncbi:uncharacterized protein [Clytia hemisphaerica]|uniref:uncharacterized protein n=1 Tax=Clytia hemisphaerica TaxID=252671 RepID=UPI0034D642EE